MAQSSQSKLVISTKFITLVISCEENFAPGADIKEMMDMGPEEARGLYFNKTYAKIENLLIPTTAMSEYAYGPQVGDGARGVGLVGTIPTTSG